MIQVFVATFLPGKLHVATGDGKLAILTEGAARKFLDQVEHVTFSGPFAISRSQPVLYITERCVFALRQDGLELIEIAPAIDLERDVIAHMEFAPMIAAPDPMDARIFRSETMRSGFMSGSP